MAVMLRNSERSSFKTCRFRWALTYGGVWEVGPVRSREPAKALWFGDLIHRALAAYRPPGTKFGPKPRTTFLKLYDADERLGAVLRNDEGEWESMRDLGAGMLAGYVETFRDRDAEWEVLSSEATFRVPVKVPAFRAAPHLLPSSPRLIVVGTFDGVWRHRVDKGRIVFPEYKTAASISLDGLAMDDQASYYWTYGPRWLWKRGVLPRGEYPTEILYTFLRKAIRNPEKTYDADGHVLNKDGTISKSQPSPYFVRHPVYRDAIDRANLHKRVLAEFRDMAEVRADPSRVYKNPGPLHNPNCRGCPVRDPCELHETGADWLLSLNATTEPWDPYADHELPERR